MPPALPPRRAASISPAAVRRAANASSNSVSSPAYSAARPPVRAAASCRGLKSIGGAWNRWKTNTSTPVSRISACSGIFQYALISSDRRAASTESAVR